MSRAAPTPSRASCTRATTSDGSDCRARSAAASFIRARCSATRLSCCTGPLLAAASERDALLVGPLACVLQNHVSRSHQSTSYRLPSPCLGDRANHPQALPPPYDHDMSSRLSVTLSDELAEGIAARARRSGKTKSEVVREALRIAGLQQPSATQRSSPICWSKPRPYGHVSPSRRTASHCCTKRAATRCGCGCCGSRFRSWRRIWPERPAAERIPEIPIYEIGPKWRGWESNPRHHDFQLPWRFRRFAAALDFPC